MRTIVITLLLSLFIIPGNAQNSKYEYFGRYNPSVKKEKLKNAISIYEIMPEFSRYVVLQHKERLLLEEQLKLREQLQLNDQLNGYYIYPQDFYDLPLENYRKIIYFVSMEIFATCKGKTSSAQSINTLLTKEQKNLLNTADLGSDIRIKVKFRYKSQATVNSDDLKQTKEGEYAITVVPETEAGYPGGFKEMSDYLTKSFFYKLPQKSYSKKIREAVVKFVITEMGQVTEARISRTSSDPNADKLLLDAINKMPKWRPAKDLNGKSIRQEFSIPLNGGGGGC
jgi:TonB family protein